MTLLERQHSFSRMVVKLLAYAHAMGYEITFGDAYRDKRCPYGSEKSMHHHRLAIDINLFKDGKYLISTEDHKPLGEFWESMGGVWGGRFNDGNHYEAGEKQ